MSKAEKIHAKLLSMLDGDPYILADERGDYLGTVIVNWNRKMWTVIKGEQCFDVRRMEIPEGGITPSAAWTKVARTPLRIHPKIGRRNLCRTDEGLAELASFMDFENEGGQWLKEQDRQAKEEADRKWRKLMATSPTHLVAGYTIEECRSGIQHSHPDKGGDPHLFELWKARLEYAKSQEASNQP